MKEDRELSPVMYSPIDRRFELVEALDSSEDERQPSSGFKSVALVAATLTSVAVLSLMSVQSLRSLLKRAVGLEDGDLDDLELEPLEDKDSGPTSFRRFLNPYGIDVTPKPEVVPANPEMALSERRLGEKYRSRFSFPKNIRNAQGLSRNGTYTQEEADTILALHAKRVNTGVTGTMPQHVFDYIVARAPDYGIDPIVALKYAALESGGNPYAISPTGAIGVFQFVGGTASDYGIKNRFDYRQNIEAGLRFAARNKSRLVGEGLPVDDLSLYLAHQIGMGGAREVLSVSPQTPISALSRQTQRNVRLNIGGRSSTVGEYLEANRVALRRTFQSNVVAAYGKPSEHVTQASPSQASGNATVTPTPAPRSSLSVPVQNSTPPPKTERTRPEARSTKPTTVEVSSLGSPDYESSFSSSSGRHLPQDLVSFNGIALFS